MKRYLLFAVCCYEPAGGLDDLRGGYDSLEDAIHSEESKEFLGPLKDYDLEILDTKNGEVHFAYQGIWKKHKTKQI